MWAACFAGLRGELTVGHEAPFWPTSIRSESAPQTEPARRGERGASVARPAARLNSFESIIEESKRCGPICTPASGAANEGQRSNVLTAPSS